MRLNAEKPAHTEAIIVKARNAVRSMVVRVVQDTPAPNTYHRIEDGVERIGDLYGPPYMEISQYADKAGNLVTKVVAETETWHRQHSTRRKAIYAYSDPQTVVEAIAMTDSFVITDPPDSEVHFEEDTTREPKDAREVIMAAGKEIIARTGAKKRRNPLARLSRRVLPKMITNY